MRIWLKAAGLCCVFTACFLIGTEEDRRLKQRWLFLREMYEMLAYLEKEMIFHRTPLPEALRSAAASCRTCLGGLLKMAAEKTESRENRSFQDIWKESAAKWVPCRLLPETESAVLLESAAALCGTDTVMQRTLILKYEQRFQMLSENARQEWQEKGGLYRRLSVAAGAFLVILLM